jgi:hypothetical protein
MEFIFGKHNEIRAHQLKNQLISLNKNDLCCIECYLSKFKTLGILLKDCKIKMKDNLCVYAIISKLGSGYSVFISTFHSTRDALGDFYTPPSLKYFFDYFIRE